MQRLQLGSLYRGHSLQDRDHSSSFSSPSANMLRILTLAVLLRPPSTALSSDVTSYTRVSKNGQLARSYHDSLSWIKRPSARNDTRAESENRSMNGVVSITMSPVYVPARTQKLKKGEAIDHSAVASKYSTLDDEMIAKLDAAGRHRQIQHRFHAPANFEHGNGKPQKGASTSNAEGTNSNANSSPFPGPLAPDIYDYSPAGLADDQAPASKPMISNYPSISTDEKNFPSDSYRPSSNEYHVGDDAHETDFSGFDGAPYENDGPKPIKFTNHHYDDERQPPPPFTDDDHPEDQFNHHHHHELIYDHVPEFYGDHHYHHKTTTEEPEMNDQRLDKRPYSYYFIGKKLWYIPLYFSIYFIIYIAALVLKSIARHKIDFPGHLADAVSSSHGKRSESSEGWWNFAERILDGAERFAEGSHEGS